MQIIPRLRIRQLQAIRQSIRHFPATISQKLGSRLGSFRYLSSLHKVCIVFHNLIKKCALSVPDADFADLVQTLQTWCTKTSVRPVLARPPYKHHRPDCTQTLQTLRPCPKSPDHDSKRTYSQPPVSSRHGASKMTFAKSTAQSSALARLPNRDQASKRA